MTNIIRTEILKLKRYRILWAGIALMLLSVLLTLFTSLADDGSYWDFKYLIEQVIKNNMTMIFPMCITLITGYVISREQRDDTLKNTLTIPITLQKLMTGKLFVCGLISIFFGIVCFVFTLGAQLVVNFPGLRSELMVQALYQITFYNLFCYIALMPIIVLTSRSPSGFLVGVIIAFVYGYGGLFATGNMTIANLYPISAALGLIGYRSYDPAVSWNYVLCTTSLLMMMVITGILLAFMKEKRFSNKVKKKKTQSIKKGW